MFDQVPAYSIAVARIFWGLVMMWEVYSYMQRNYAKAYVQLVQPPFLFHYYGFDWVPRLSLDHWKLVINTMMLCGAMFTVGFLYHIAAFVFAVLFALLFLQDMSFYLNHFYLVAVLCFAYAFVPANKFWALDSLGISRHSPTVPFWTVAMTRILVSVVYFYAGYAKMNEDWIRGVPLSYWVPRRAHQMPLFAPILTHYSTALMMSWSGLLIDSLLPFMFILPRLRPLAFLISFAFHIMNKIIFNIGIFPWVMSCVTTIFFRPDWPRVVYRTLTLQSNARRVDAGDSVPFNRRAALSLSQKLVLVLLGSFLFWQTATPLRHHFYGGQVEWDEEGHLCSWRMKLRDKAGMTKFYVKYNSTETGEPVNRVVDPHDLLTGAQVKKMNGRPQMILLFALHLADLMEKSLGTRPAVHVLSIASLNYRTPQFLIDPTVNLAAAKPWTWIGDWVVPLVPLGVTEHPAFVRNGVSVGNDESKNRLYKQFGHLTIDAAIAQVSEAKLHREQQ
jgi:vitamin K-dependent gamma-carboxylase